MSVHPQSIRRHCLQKPAERPPVRNSPIFVSSWIVSLQVMAIREQAVRYGFLPPFSSPNMGLRRSSSSESSSSFPPHADESTWHSVMGIRKSLSESASEDGCSKDRC